MQRFFFDCFDGIEFHPDQHGIYLEDLTGVADHAADLVMAIASEDVASVGSKAAFIIVRDRSGARIHIASCTFVGRTIDP